MPFPVSTKLGKTTIASMAGILLIIHEANKFAAELPLPALESYPELREPSNQRITGIPEDPEPHSPGPDL